MISEDIGGESFSNNHIKSRKEPSPKVKRILLTLGLVAATSTLSFQIGAAKENFQIERQLVADSQSNKPFFEALKNVGYIKQSGYFVDSTGSNTFKESDNETLEKALLSGTMTEDSITKDGVKVDKKYKIELREKNLAENLVGKALDFFNLSNNFKTKFN